MHVISVIINAIIIIHAVKIVKNRHARMPAKRMKPAKRNATQTTVAVIPNAVHASTATI
jgi:hypothetical protein